MLPSEDFYQEFLSASNRNEVRYMIFGGFAVNLYGFARVTEDLDIWIDPSPENFLQLERTVIDLGFPKDSGTLKSFISGKSILLRLSDDNFRIDVMTKLNIKKSFAEAFKVSTAVDMPYGKIFFLGYDDLIDEKIRSKSPKDLIDVDQLRKLRNG